MSSVRELHTKAMALSDMANALFASDSEKAHGLLLEAYALEEKAARQIGAIADNEPTRSVLYISAASIAMQARDYKSAQRMVAMGLSGYPQPREERNLLELFEQITMGSHLDVRGVVLDDTDFQLSIFGEFVGAGFAPLNMIMDRLDSIGSLLKRTYERLCEQPYTGKRQAGFFGKLQPVISVPRAASFAVTVRLARPIRTQVPLIEQVTAADVINELMTCVEYINEGDDEKLMKQIPDDAYYRNFVSLTKSVAPDGDKVKIVGLTSKVKRVALKKTRKAVAQLPMPEIKVEKLDEHFPFEGTGRLDYVSGHEDLIGLIVGDKLIQINMQNGLEDFVRQYYGQDVNVVGVKNIKGVVTPTAINPVDE